MSLAIGFLIIFLLAVPGIVFRITYLSSPYSKRNINTTTLEEIYSSLIPAFIFHSISILVLAAFHFTINFQFIFNLLIGSNTAKDINRLNDYLVFFLLYMLINTVINFMFARLLRWVVLRNKLYKNYPALSIYNKWYDILKPQSTDDNPISVWLDILVETKNDVLIYRGFLTDFWLDKDGGIKELHLEDVRRRKMTEDIRLQKLSEKQGQVPAVQAGNAQVNIQASQPENRQTAIAENADHIIYESDIAEEIDERYYYIPGERFIIKYEDVKNMNITYYSEE